MKSMKLLMLMVGSLSGTLLFGASGRSEEARVYVKNDSGVDLSVGLKQALALSGDRGYKVIKKDDKSIISVGTMSDRDILSYYYNRDLPDERQYVLQWKDINTTGEPAVLVTISYKRGWVPGTWEFTNNIQRYDDLADDTFELMDGKLRG